MTPDRLYELTHPHRAIYWRARIFLLALRWPMRFTIGDEAYDRQGVRWRIVNGVTAPRWDVSRGSHEQGTYERSTREESELRRVKTPAALLASFRRGWWFYRTSWYMIWMRGGVQPWMRALPIWGRKRARS